MNLSTTYLGLQLKNPIIAGASNLTANPEKAILLQEAGAAAIVYKSLFEEQLDLEAAELEDEIHAFDDRHAEMVSVFPNIQHAGPQAHLMAVKSFKQTLSIPVIASLNCHSKDTWADFAVQLAQTGVDALELNFYSTISDHGKSPQEIEKEQIDTLTRVKQAVSIPIGIKLSPFYTNPLSFIQHLDAAGANGIVLFNRFFQPNINIFEETLEMPYNLSQKGDNRTSLRYMGLLCGEIKAGLCANSGILEGDDVIASILAGADAVQVVSTLYLNGPKQITKMLGSMEDWMQKKGYNSVVDFKGKMSRKNLNDPYAYNRAQYVDFLMKSKEFENKYPVR
jgi:dihydroorotate dehydrogenase (fumarate)